MNTRFAFQFPHPSRHSQQTGFTLIELLVVIAIIAILASLLSVNASKSLEKARQVSCSGNQKQIQLAFTHYTIDNNFRLPPVCNIGDGWRVWAYYLIPYIGEDSLREYGPNRSGPEPSTSAGRSVFVCPSYNRELPGRPLERKFLGGYGMNRRLPPNETKDEDFSNTIGGNDWVAQYQSQGILHSISDSAQRVLIACGSGSNGDLETYWQASNPENISFSKKRHNKGANILYLDGHVAHMSGAEIVLRAANEKGQSGTKKYPMLFRSGQ